MSKETKGYLYVAFGVNHIEEALNSVSSLKTHVLNAHATLITNQPFENKLFDNVINVAFNASDYKSGTLFKVLGLQQSPYEQTFYVDVDTYFVDDCSELFDLLHYFDLLIAQDPSDTSVIKRDHVQLEGYYPYNTGVIVFNNTITIKNFFKDWLKAFEENYEAYLHDQPAFMEALLTHSINYYVLPNVYNLRKPAFASILGKRVKLIHGRMDDFKSIALTLNKHHSEHRSWIPTKKRVIRISQTRRRTREFLRRLKRRFYSKLD